ncbi:MAG: hypothetical protein ABSE62_14300 [Chthoniobacteraceae bacterium]|jgi:hypothetical protein
MKITRKTIASLLLGAATLASSASLQAQQAQENAYDVLGKALVPIVSVFVLDANGQLAPRGLVIDAHLVQASKLPPVFADQAIHLAVMTPDRVLVQAPFAGQMLTVCRQGDSLWATPGSQIQSLLALAPSAPLSEKKKKKRAAEAAKVLGPLVLPVTQQELVFLPVLFQCADAGNDTIAGVSCRMLDVSLMPALAKSLHADNWSGRLWVGPNYTIVKISLAGPTWSGAVAIDKLAFPATLPDATFQPQGADVLKLTARQFLDLLSQFGSK